MLNNLLVQQNFTIARNSGNILMQCCRSRVCPSLFAKLIYVHIFIALQNPKMCWKNEDTSWNHNETIMKPSVWPMRHQLITIEQPAMLTAASNIERKKSKGK